jgi:hypothetical protein
LIPLFFEMAGGGILWVRELSQKNQKVKPVFDVVVA